MMDTISDQAAKSKKEQLQIFIDEIEPAKSVIVHLLTEFEGNKRRLMSIKDLQLNVASSRDDPEVDYQETFIESEIKRIQTKLKDKTEFLGNLVEKVKRYLAGVPSETPLVLEAKVRLIEAEELLKHSNVSLGDKETTINSGKSQSLNQAKSDSEVTAILDLALQKATKSIKTPIINDTEIIKRIEIVATNAQNRSCVRFIMACALAKIDKPAVDIRKPYTEIGGNDSFSGRTYDELYITKFISKNELPCNLTTAFLTPTFRYRNVVLTPNINLVGRPTNVYKATLQLLDDVYQKKLTADDLLTETIRWLLIAKPDLEARVPPRKRKLRVFLCHSSGDKPNVEKFYNLLVKDGFDAWLDKKSLLPGQDWQFEIQKAVRNSDIVLVFLSSSSITKEGFVQKEIRFALDIADEKPDGTIFIIPARLEICDVPERISKFHWVDLFESDGYAHLIRALQTRASSLNMNVKVQPK